MMKLTGPMSALLGLVCLITPAKADLGSDRVQAEFVANVAAIKPGKAFWAGFKFTIKPGYHIYWKNPGDSGLATEVKLSLPSGFTAGELMFPVPTREQMAGDIVNYAYEKQVMLLVQITPPKDLPVGKSFTLNAKTNWLVCKDDCAPGHADVSLNLPVADTASPANEELFKTWGGRLPVKDDSADLISWAGSLAGEHGLVKINWKTLPSDIQYFPGPTQTGDVDSIKINTTGNTTAITFDIKNHTESEVVPGLVKFTTPTGVTMGLNVSIPGLLMPAD